MVEIGRGSINQLARWPTKYGWELTLICLPTLVSACVFLKDSLVSIMFYSTNYIEFSFLLFLEHLIIQAHIKLFFLCEMCNLRNI